MSQLPPLLLVGGGRMGSAMFEGWRQRGLAPSVIVDPSAAALSLTGPDVRICREFAEIPPDFAPAAVIFAVKPQAAAALTPYARYENALFMSIMAGKTIAAIAALVGQGAAIIRAMPNTPAAIRQGFSVAVAGTHVAAAQHRLAETLLAAIGQIAWVEDEALLDPVTAISGGGPAYLFLLTELLEQAAIGHGIAAPLARALARQTIIGSAALLAAGDADAAALRGAVTSPKGTTEQALAILRAPGAWPEIFTRAIDAATKRSRDLSD